MQTLFSSKKIKQGEQGRYSLRLHLLLSFSTLIFVLFMIALPFFYFFDIFDAPKKKISDALDNYLVNYEKSVSYQFDNIAAYGIQLNKSLVAEIERTLDENKIASFKNISDNRNLLKLMQENTSDVLKSSLLISKSSGAFVSFNATVNSSLSKTTKTCSGVYLKISNLNNFNDINPTIFLLRGMPELGDYHDIELYNMWEMELDEAECMQDTFAKDYSNIHIDSRYSFLEPRYIKQSWEKVILLVTPLIGTNGEVYGICGLEISSLLYSLSHRSIQASIDGIIGSIALESNSQNPPLLNLDNKFLHGMISSQGSEHYTIEQNNFYKELSNGVNKFAAKTIEFHPSAISIDDSNTKWQIVALLPQELEDELIAKNNMFLLLGLSAFILIAFVISYILVYRASSPILTSLKQIQEGTETNSDILEFNDLIEHLKNKEQKLRLKQQKLASDIDLENNEQNSEDNTTLQADITAYNTFIEQLSTLTKSERKVFELYVQKMDSHQVANELNVSINTIRTHNRNIYSKLYVSSYKELMVYIQMMVGSTKFYETE